MRLAAQCGRYVQQRSAIAVMTQTWKTMSLVPNPARRFAWTRVHWNRIWTTLLLVDRIWPSLSPQPSRPCFVSLAAWQPPCLYITLPCSPQCSSATSTLLPATSFTFVIHPSPSRNLLYLHNTTPHTLQTSDMFCRAITLFGLFAILASRELNL